MTVQELRDLLTAAPALPWSIVSNLEGCDTSGDWIVSADDDAIVCALPADAALIIAAVNALPALLNLAEAVQDHNCPNEHWSWLDNPPHCRTCHALNQLENQ